jgi:hypothetical protein
MLPAKAFEILCYRESAGSRILVVERNRVVNVADRGRATASEEAAGQIPATDGAFKCRRWLVTQRLHRAGKRIGDE